MIKTTTAVVPLVNQTTVCQVGCTCFNKIDESQTKPFIYEES